MSEVPCLMREVPCLMSEVSTLTAHYLQPDQVFVQNVAGRPWVRVRGERERESREREREARERETRGCTRPRHSTPPPIQGAISLGEIKWPSPGGVAGGEGGGRVTPHGVFVSSRYCVRE